MSEIKCANCGHELNDHDWWQDVGLIVPMQECGLATCDCKSFTARPDDRFWLVERIGVEGEVWCGENVSGRHLWWSGGSGWQTDVNKVPAEYKFPTKTNAEIAVIRAGNALLQNAKITDHLIIPVAARPDEANNWKAENPDGIDYSLPRVRPDEAKGDKYLDERLDRAEKFARMANALFDGEVVCAGLLKDFAELELKLSNDLITAIAKQLSQSYQQLQAERTRRQDAFRWSYAGVVCVAQQLLKQANDEREGEMDWPAGQTWDEINGSSRSIFLRQSRSVLGIPHDEFLAPIRTGELDVEDLYERIFDLAAQTSSSTSEDATVAESK